MGNTKGQWGTTGGITKISTTRPEAPSADRQAHSQPAGGSIDRHLRTFK